MADPLFLSLWFPSFEAEDMLPRALAVLRQFPFSAQRPGVTYLALHPVSWSEPTTLERRFVPGVAPESAILAASEQIHEDYAYVFEAYWDIWAADLPSKEWKLEPSLVKFTVRALEFDDASYEQDGHIQIDLGLDSSFLQEGAALTPEAKEHVRDNVQQLVSFSTKLEKSSGASGRILWSESEENFAQKLMSRVQTIQ